MKKCIQKSSKILKIILTFFLILLLLRMIISMLMTSFLISTDLFGESVDGIKIGDYFDSNHKSMYSDYIDFEYESTSGYWYRAKNKAKYYRIKLIESKNLEPFELLIGINKETNKVIQIKKSYYDDLDDLANYSPFVAGNKGVFFGDSIEKAINIYGENYSKSGGEYGEHEEYTYVDKTNKIDVSFLVNSDGFIYSYSTGEF